jgi:hypothetical protein
MGELNWLLKYGQRANGKYEPLGGGPGIGNSIGIGICIDGFGTPLKFIGSPSVKKIICSPGLM